MGTYPGQYLSYKALLVYLFTCLSRFSPDLWAYVESFYQQNKVQTESIESEIPTYLSCNEPDKSSIPVNRETRSHQRSIVPDIIREYPFNDIATLIKSLNSGHIIPSAYQIVIAVAPKIKTEMIKGAGHDLPLVQPLAVNAKVLRFLAIPGNRHR
jgi:pimeloyl-ACP methyl ester carboxylesterase